MLLYIMTSYHDICNYWHAEDSGIMTAKIDEQKTDSH